MGRSLEIIAGLRRRAVDAAHQELVARIRRADLAAAALRDASAALVREREVATSLLAGDEAVEAFANWLPRGQRAVETARAAQADAQAAVAHARARLAGARAAAEAIMDLLARQAGERRLARQRGEQGELDEIAGEIARRARPPLDIS
jgi:flagellar export protein FliJ